MNKQIILNNPRKYIVKSNSLVEARYRLSLQESKIILWLLTQIRPDDEDFKSHQMTISEFSKMIGVEVDNQYSKLRDVTQNLMRRILNIYEPEKNEWLQVAWLSSARYQGKKGIVILKFDPELKPYLLQLKSHFTKLDIVDTMKLKSVHSIRMFELLLQYLTIGNRKMTLEDLRAWCGIQKDEYNLYADVKRYVINRAKTEITAKTEYEIDYQEIKESRKVVAIQWTIKKKRIQPEGTSQKVRQLQKEYRSESALIDSLVEYGFSRTIAKRFITNNGEDAVSDALKAVNIQVERATVKNPRAMIQMAIKEKWKPEVYKARKYLN
jgi:plasmid replication initiation protein